MRVLARFASKSRDARRRIAETEDPLRTAFQRDRDRVIHCSAFRRLQHKTQVVAAYEGDHFRSRMTHSLEVSQMARGVARALCLNADLCEAIALAHDLGHPPFGHVGERALDELLQGHGGFRHNAQGLRIVDILEERYGAGLGLNLTDVTRRSLIKGAIPDGFPLVDDVPGLAARPAPIEAQVVDCCDRIAYLCHDLDDGLRAGVFGLDDARQTRLWRRAADAASDPHPARVISEMIALLVHDLVAQIDLALAAASDAEPPAGIRHGDELAVLSEELLRFLRERFYRSDRVLSVMESGADKIRAAFQGFVERPDELPENVRARIDVDGLQRTVGDYVSGMTDRYLVRTTG